MLFRNSISKTKKFFHKTLQSVKSLFSGDYYQRLPKTPPHSLGYTDMMNVQPNYKELDKFYSDFTDQWGLELDKDKAKKGNKKKTMSSSPSKQEKEVYNGNFMKFSQASSVKKNQIERKEEYNNHDDDEKKMKKSIVRHERKRNEDSCFKGKREVRTCLVAQKLKELEMLDMSNVDHLLDIEEVLHYYSRLTCPAYLDIVDKFFMDMYAEFFNGATTLTPAPTLRRRTVRS